MISVTESIQKLPMTDRIRELYKSDLDAKEFDIYYQLGRMFGAGSILEVGVCCGYSAFAMCLGAKPLVYVGIDAEMFLDESNVMAESLLASDKRTSEVQTRFLKYNTLTQYGEIRRALGRRVQFDWVHIDGAHEAGQAEIDIANFWPMTGRVMTIHDINSHPHVRRSFDKVTRGELVDFSSYMEIPSSHGFGVLSR